MTSPQHGETSVERPRIEPIIETTTTQVTRTDHTYKILGQEFCVEGEETQLKQASSILGIAWVPDEVAEQAELAFINKEQELDDLKREPNSIRRVGGFWALACAAAGTTLLVAGNGNVELAFGTILEAGAVSVAASEEQLARKTKAKNAPQIEILSQELGQLTLICTALAQKNLQ